MARAEWREQGGSEAEVKEKREREADWNWKGGGVRWGRAINFWVTLVRVCHAHIYVYALASRPRDLYYLFKHTHTDTHRHRQVCIYMGAYTNNPTLLLAKKQEEKSTKRFSSGVPSPHPAHNDQGISRLWIRIYTGCIYTHIHIYMCYIHTRSDWISWEYAEQWTWRTKANTWKYSQSEQGVSITIDKYQAQYNKSWVW